MRRSKKLLSLLIILALVILSACAQNTVPADESTAVTAAKSAPDAETVYEPPAGIGVSLKFLGRASVRLDFADGRVIYIDPAYGRTSDYEQEADIVLVTHQHGDHNKTSLTTLKEDGVLIECPNDIKSGDTIEIGDITIEAVDAYNSNHSKVVCCGFIISWNGLVIYHSGDTSTTEQMENGYFEDYDIDYALLCMDGYYNMGVEEAAQVAAYIDACAIMPIHTSADGAHDANQAMLFEHPNRLLIDRGETIDLYDLSQNDGVHEALDTAIVGIMEDRKIAIDTEDYDLYMSVIGRNNQFFFNEQERWFMNMIEESITDVEFEIVSVEMLDSKNGVVNIHQTHKMGEDFDFEYPLHFTYEDGQWMDYGYHFEVYETERFMVKYTPEETKLEDFTRMLDDAFDNLDSVYDLKPLPDYEMKLFADQEMLRQRCIPANLWLFTGWSEPDESIKMYTGHDIPYESYAGVVQHELVHHITIRICNNNLPVWLLEGIAMYDGTAPYGLEYSKLLSSISKNNVSLSIDYIEVHDLGTDLSRQEIYNYYNTSYMYVRYIVETYGRDKLMEIFYEAGKKPFHDSTLNDTFESKNQETAGEVIMTVLNLTKEELSNEYLDWLMNLTIDELKDIG